jgi:RND family efflux transporter MFP subunit
MRPMVIISLLASIGLPANAEPLTLAPVQVTDWKAVYGRIEARDRIPARARLGGTLVELTVVEGDLVTAGQPLARIVDEKLAFQLSAVDAQLDAAKAQLENAQVELKRGEDLLKQGVTTVQRLDGLRTQVDVLIGQIASITAQRRVIEQQATEGEVLAPVAGRVLQVPLAKGAVVMPGEAVATLGGGGIFLRLAVPERHAANLHEGDTIQIEAASGPQTGTLARVYPLIENGRVVADVEVAGLPDTFIDARVLVRLPVGTHSALMVPATAVMLKSGLDFVSTGSQLRVVVPGVHEVVGGIDMVEILSGLQPGDVIETEGAQHD